MKKLDNLREKKLLQKLTQALLSGGRADRPSADMQRIFAELSKLSMPQTYSPERTVWQIEGRTLVKCSALAENGKLTVPEGVVKIEGGAFDSIESEDGFTVELPSTLRLIGIKDGCKPFSKCPNIAAIYVSEENPVFCSHLTALYSRDKKILYCAPIGGRLANMFEVAPECEIITELSFADPEKCGLCCIHHPLKLVLPEKMRVIERKAFLRSMQIMSLAPNKGLERIEKEAFSGCRALERIEGGFGCAIESLAFANCISLKKIVLTDSVTELGAGAFLWTGLEEIRLSPNIGTLRGNTFFMCGELTEVNVPEGVVKIEKSTFKNCGKLRKLHLPDSLEIIEDGAVTNAEALEEINIPPKVRITDKTIGGLRSLKRITLAAEDPFHVLKDGMVFSRDMKRLLLAENGADRLSAAGVEEIGENIFCGCKFDEFSVTAEETLTLREYAFKRSSAVNVVFAAKRVVFGGRAIFSDSGIGKLTFCAEEIVLHSEAFMRCSVGELRLECEKLILCEPPFCEKCQLKNFSVKAESACEAEKLVPVIEGNISAKRPPVSKRIPFLVSTFLENVCINNVHFTREMLRGTGLDLYDIIDVINERIRPDMPSGFAAALAAALYAKYGSRLVREREAALAEKDRLLPLLVADNNAAVLEALAESGDFVTAENAGQLVDLAIEKGSGECFVILSKFSTGEDMPGIEEKFAL